MDPITQKLLQKFRSVCEKRTERIVTLLISCEENPQQKNTAIHEILGELHTLKGESRMLGLTPISNVCHTLEDYLKPLLQHNQIPHNPTLIPILDQIKIYVHQAADGKTPKENFSNLLEPLKHQPNTTPYTPPPKKHPSDSEIYQLQQAKETFHQIQDNLLQLNTQKLDQLSASIEEILLLLQNLQNSTHQLQQHNLQLKKHSSQLLPSLQTHYQQIPTSLQQTLSQLSKNFKTHQKSIEQCCENLQKISLELHSYCEELIDKNLELRLTPLSTILPPLYRNTYEISNELNKKVKLQTHNLEIEIDKKILSSLQNILLHLLRNAIDHGIEYPHERKILHKPERGTITISASTHGSYVEISIHDDGKGINPDKIFQQALEKQLIQPNPQKKWTSTEKLNLIFLPGFSSKKQANQISGQGIGMNYVKETIENLRGTVQINSQKNQGTTITLQIPITLAILPALILRVDKFLLCIPSQYVEKVLYLKEIHYLSSIPTLTYQNQDLPIQWLHHTLSIQHQSTNHSHYPVLLLQLDTKQPLALFVDEFVEEKEITLKPLNPFLKRNSCFSAATLLEENKLAYLLNIPWLKQKLSQNHPKHYSPPKPHHSPPTILLVEDSHITREMEKNILQSLGYHVIEAENGKHALQILQQNPTLHLMITDFEMPEMNGPTLIQQVRKIKSFQNLPILVISTLSSEKDKQTSFQAGANDYIPKSQFHQNILKETIEKWIQTTPPKNPSNPT